MPREVIVGTSDGLGSHPTTTTTTTAAGDFDKGEGETPQEMPSLAAVEAHTQRLRVALCNNRYATAGYHTRVVIAPSDLSRIATLCDLLDQLRYWAIEESTTFRHEPSRLAEAEAPEAVVACVCSGRPPLMAQALRVMEPMLVHRQTASELRRVLRERHPRMTTATSSRDDRANASNDRDANVLGDAQQLSSLQTGGDPVLLLLADLMGRHKGSIPVLTGALRSATRVVAQCTPGTLSDNANLLNAAAENDGCIEDSGCSADVDADMLDSQLKSLSVVLFESPLVFHVEAALRRYSDVVQIQVEGVEFFAALVDLPALPVEFSEPPPPPPQSSSQFTQREEYEMHDDVKCREDGGQEEEQEHGDASSYVSMTDVLAHSDGVLDVLQQAMQRHRQHLTLCRRVLHIWRVCAMQHTNNSNSASEFDVSNCVSLLQHGVYSGALRQLCEVGPYALDVVRDAAEIVGYFIPFLDALQRRSLLLALAKLLRQRPQLDMIQLVLALLIAVLTVVRARHAPSPAAAGTSSGRAGSRAFDRYALCPQPPSTSRNVGLCVRQTDAEGHEAKPHKSTVHLQISSMQWQPARSLSCDDTRDAAAGAQDTWEFMMQTCALPQLVLGVREYLRSCDLVDEADASEVRRVCALADAVLSFF